MELSFSMICMALIAVMFGLVMAFAGYRLFLVLLPIWGFVFGFALGAQTMTVLFGQAFLATVAGWVVGFLVGLVFAVFSYLFYMIGVAVFAGSFGYALGIGIMGLFGITNWLAWLVGIAMAIIVAAVVLIFNLQKVAIIIVSGLIGSAVTIIGLLSPWANYVKPGDFGTGGVVRIVLDSLGSTSVVWIIIWLAVAIFGMVVQFRANKNYEIEAATASNW
jgi:hypothetical protein